MGGHKDTKIRHVERDRERADPSRPGWKGPGFVKKQPKQPARSIVKEKEKEKEREQVIPTELQQLVLDIFKHTFPTTLDSNELSSLLQQVKHALFERDFETAFGRKEYLETYAVRWSPSRALCYMAVLADLKDHLSCFFDYSHSLQPNSPVRDAEKGVPVESLDAESLRRPVHIACFGGGAAEVVAFGGFLRFLQGTTALGSLGDVAAPSTLENTITTLSLSQKPASQSIRLSVVDTAEWSDVVQQLATGLITPPPVSKYASAATRKIIPALLAEEAMATAFERADVFDLQKNQLASLFGNGPALVTLLFTLNELYSASISKATKFLLDVTAAAEKDTLLLVVDSPGSYSEAQIGKESKKYPMQWLMDHTLLSAADRTVEGGGPSWKKIETDDSRWFRLPDNLLYSIPLENMRYQMHLFRRL